MVIPIVISCVAFSTKSSGNYCSIEVWRRKHSCFLCNDPAHSSRTLFFMHALLSHHHKGHGTRKFKYISIHTSIPIVRGCPNTQKRKLTTYSTNSPSISSLFYSTTGGDHCVFIATMRAVTVPCHACLQQHTQAQYALVTVLINFQINIHSTTQQHPYKSHSFLWRAEWSGRPRKERKILWRKYVYFPVCILSYEC